jgi:hypothetical protein
MARALRGDHDHIVAARRCDAPVVDVEAVREEDGGAFRQMRLDLRVEHLRLHLVGHQQGNDLGSLHGLRDRPDGKSGGFGRGPRRAPRAQADLDVDAGVAQVERVRVPLAPVAEDRDLAGEEIRGAFAVDGCHGESSFRSLT